MKADVKIATFLILERDSVVQMDIRETLRRSFRGWPVIMVPEWEALPRALDEAKGSRIVIVSADLENFSDGLSKIKSEENVGAVLVSEGSTEAPDLPVPYTVLQRPFKTDHLLTAVRIALERLRSSQ